MYLQSRIIAWRSVVLGLLISGCTLFPLPSHAGFIISDDLFLAPSLVPKDFYTPLVLSTGDTYTYSVSDVPGASRLDAIRILPLLNPNPATSQGEYSPTDLAGITEQNYMSYFADLPNEDYFATSIDANSSSVTFATSGSYFVQLQTFDGTTVKTTLIHTEVSDFFLGDDNKAGPGRVLADPPNVDLYVISTKDPPGNNAMKIAMKRFPKAPTANNLDDVYKAIEAAYKANGKKKIRVVLIGHGAEGSIEMGSDRIDNVLKTRAANFQKKIDPWVSAVFFYSCKTFGGDDGKDFQKQILESMGTGGWRDEITIGEKRFDADAGAKLSFDSTSVPEPGSLTLVLLGGAVGIGVVAFRRLRFAFNPINRARTPGHMPEIPALGDRVVMLAPGGKEVVNSRCHSRIPVMSPSCHSPRNSANSNTTSLRSLCRRSARSSPPCSRSR